MAENEQRHWWFTGRRQILATLLRRELSRGRAPAPMRILEAGCGSGGNLGMLGAFGTVEAVEYDPGARAIAERRSGLVIRPCALPHDLPVPDRSYDLIALLDVLEHVEEDRASLAALGAKLKRDGRILVTVPALPWLWSHHDAVHHHKRRYTARSLTDAVAAAGLRVERVGYFNTLLFPLALARRVGSIVTGRPTEDDRVPARWMNALLRTIFSAERHLVGRVRMALGLSLFALVSLPD
ncbi:class I SAM-dependent methyltransferase [Methylobacterium planeticum]|nr:class I SAM-dependent methyltransferase [Methylobacterium planeticum]